MANRSTRNKLRLQAEYAITNLSLAINHMANLDTMAEDRSRYITDKLPMIVGLLETCEKYLTRFREGL